MKIIFGIVIAAAMIGIVTGLAAERVNAFQPICYPTTPPTPVLELPPGVPAASHWAGAELCVTNPLSFQVGFALGASLAVMLGYVLRRRNRSDAAVSS